MHLLQRQFDMSDPTVTGLSRRRRSLLAAAALVPVLWSAGCAPAKPLVLAGHPWPGYETMFLAHSLGYMPEQLTLMETRRAHDTIKAIKNGSADGGMLTLDEVLLLRDQGRPLEIVLVFDISRGADVLLAHPKITQLGALKGRRIGLEDSALGSLLLTLILERAGLQMGDVSLRRVAYDDHEASWGRGDVDALITYEPVAGRLKARGARQLLSTRDLADTIFDVLAVSPDAARAHGDTLRATLAGHFKALRYMRENPWDAAYRVAPRLGVSAEEMIASLRGLELPDLVGNRRLLADRQGELMQVTQRLSPIMQQAGQIAAPVSTRQLFTSAYLPGEAS